MTQNAMSARENILQRIRAANGRTGTLSAAEREATLASLRAHPRGPLPNMSWELLPRFKERCIAMMSSVAEVASLADVPQAVAKYLTENKLPLSGACWPEFSNLDWAGAGLQIAARPASGEIGRASCRERV